MLFVPCRLWVFSTTFLMLRFLYINAAFIAGVIMLNFVFDHNYISFSSERCVR